MQAAPLSAERTPPEPCVAPLLLLSPEDTAPAGSRAAEGRGASAGGAARAAGDAGSAAFLASASAAAAEGDAGVSPSRGCPEDPAPPLGLFGWRGGRPSAAADADLALLGVMGVPGAAPSEEASTLGDVARAAASAALFCEW